MSNKFCYEAMTGRFFKCDETKLQKIITELNDILGDKGHVSLNDYYETINRELSEDQKIRPSLLGFAYDFGFSHYVGGVEFAFQGTICADPDRETISILSCLPKSRNEEP